MKNDIGGVMRIIEAIKRILLARAMLTFAKYYAKNRGVTWSVALEKMVSQQIDRLKAGEISVSCCTDLIRFVVSVARHAGGLEGFVWA